MVKVTVVYDPIEIVDNFVSKLLAMNIMFTMVKKKKIVE